MGYTILICYSLRCTIKRYLALLHYRDPRVPRGMFPTVPQATNIAVPGVTHPPYCSANYSSSMYVCYLPPTLEPQIQHASEVHHRINRLETSARDPQAGHSD